MVSRKGRRKGVPGSKSLGGPGPRPKISEVMSRLIKMLYKKLEQEKLQQNIVQKITEHIKGTITKRPCPLAISTGIRAISAALAISTDGSDTS